jgi:hypothetical protein
MSKAAEFLISNGVEITTEWLESIHLVMTSYISGTLKGNDIFFFGDNSFIVAPEFDGDAYEI